MDDLARDTVPEYYSKNPIISGLFKRRLSLAFELGQLEGKEPLDVLDLGCGTGLLLGMFLKDYPQHRYSGWDVHPGIDDLRPKMPAVDFKRLDFRDPAQLPAKTFDRVFCLDVLEHFENLEPVLVSLRRLLKPDGLFVISEPTESWLYQLGRLASKGTTSTVDGPTGTPHYYNAAGVHAVMLKAGFKCRELRKTPPWPIDLFHVTAYGL
ncbi:MAG: methyltransferase domain-containing protein [Elusimicrobia bacterium]|nr:methyltransferase domain-containing protein [Elusimicrobiota bacterium]